ncbi:META domain-containing protein [Pontibacter rugosus]|uniref:META domain-containing protein n=1 Tax=Pontibacter rugosus TaxID=1745966 RepID=A0ABW3SKJ7_9BACT
MKKLNYVVPFLLVFLFAVGCTVQNKNQAAEDYTIKDAYWSLYALEGEDVQRPQNTMTAFIRFQENDNDVHGFTGCNKFFGKYEVGEETLKMSKLGSTRMACPLMEQENMFMAILDRVDSYRISNNFLTLYAGGNAVATFVSGTEQSIDNDVTEEVEERVDIEIDSVGIY